MFNVIVNNKKYPCPQNIYEISLIQGLQIQHLREEVKDEFSVIDKKSIIHLLSNIPYKVINVFDNESIEEIFNKIELFKEQQIKYYPVFKLDNVKYGLIDFDKMLVEDYEMMQFYLNEGASTFDNLEYLTALFYRKIDKLSQTPINILINIGNRLLFKNVIPISCKSYKTKELEEDFAVNAKYFGNRLSYSQGLAIYNHINLWLEKLSNEFKHIFKNEEPEEEIKEQEEDQETEEQKVISNDSIAGRWKFYHILASVCGDDIKLMNYWRKRKIKEFLVHTTYLNQKAIEEMQKNKK